MMQQVHRRMFPGKPVPRSETEPELSSVSLLAYLERTGGYKSREGGRTPHVALSSCGGRCSRRKPLVDKRAPGSRHGGLGAERRRRGDWSIAYLLSLAEDPPLTLFQDRTSTVSPYGTPFSPMVPPAWAATLLSYIKEMEILATKKTERSPRKPKSNTAKSDDDKSEQAPRRKSRFPKKPTEPAPVPK